MSKKNISCNVCLDLIPLVRDKVASQESTNLVNEHIKSCESCKLEFEGPTIILGDNINDDKIIKSIKKSLFLTALFLVVCGTVIGIILSNSFGMLYNILIMPVVGGLGYLILNKKWYFMNIGIFVLSYLWLFIQGIEGPLTGLNFSSPLQLSAIYTALSILGVIIAALLKFAFRKEVES